MRLALAFGAAVRFLVAAAFLGFAVLARFGAGFLRAVVLVLAVVAMVPLSVGPGFYGGRAPAGIKVVNALANLAGAVAWAARYPATRPADMTVATAATIGRLARTRMDFGRRAIRRTVWTNIAGASAGS